MMAGQRRGAKRASERCEAAEGTAAVAGVAAVVSILGNVLQAREGAEQRRRIEVLRGQQARLVGMVRDWQAEYDRLTADHGALLVERDALARRHEALTAELQRIRVERDQANRELLGAQEQVAELKEKLAAAEKPLRRR
ncbi:MAG: hypothetical protein FJ125_05695 [Deltaproteobacteria bacterium]|nr:hypothetical protein [Deltaproteobacteria bacterium]